MKEEKLAIGPVVVNDSNDEGPICMSDQLLIWSSLWLGGNDEDDSIKRFLNDRCSAVKSQPFSRVDPKGQQLQDLPGVVSMVSRDACNALEVIQANSRPQPSRCGVVDQQQVQLTQSNGAVTFYRCSGKGIEPFSVVSEGVVEEVADRRLARSRRSESTHVESKWSINQLSVIADDVFVLRSGRGTGIGAGSNLAHGFL